MAYSKQTWENLPNRTTPFTAERMTHIEEGIYDNSTDIATLEADVEQINEDLEDYALVTEAGYSVQLVLDNSTYQLQAKLKDKSGTVITSSNVIDLPIEQLVANIYYDENTKEIVFVLKSGTEVRVSIADIVSGLQTEITEQNKLSSDLVDDTNKTHKFVSTSEKTAWNAKYDKPSGGIPKTDLASAVQTSLGKADTALQQHQDISGKEDKSNKVTSISEESTDTQYPSAKAVYTKEQETKADLENQLEETNAQLDQYKKIFNALPKVNGSGEIISLDNTAETPLKMELSGNTSQFSTTGKNLLEPRATNVTINGITCTYNATNQTYTFNGTCDTNNTTFIISSSEYTFTTGLTTTSAHYVSGSTSGYCRIRNFNADYTQSVQLDLSTLSSSNPMASSTSHSTSTSNRTSIRFDNGSVANNFKIKVMIADSTDTTYEPYTNGASPNPDYPQDIEVVTGSNTIKVEGKNLVDFANPTTVSTNTTFSFSNDNVEVNGTGVYRNAEYNVTNLLKNNAGKTIKFSFDSLDISQYTSPNNNIIVLKVVYNDGTNTYYKTLLQKDGTTFDYTIPNDTSNVSNAVFQVYANNSSTSVTSKIVIKKPMLIYSTSTTDYQPHQSQEYSVNLGSLELCKIGDYKDYIYKDNGSWYKHKEIGKVVFDGSEEWVLSGNQYNVDYPYFLTSELDSVINTSASTGYMNYFKALASYTTEDNGFLVLTNNRHTRIKIYKGNLQDVSSLDATIESFKTWLSTHNTIFYYILATSVTTEITDTTLINQLDLIEKAYAYQNQTNISQDNAEKPFVIDAETLLDISNLENRVTLLED